MENPAMHASERLWSRIGTVEQEGGIRFLRTKRTEAGAVAFGPYQLLGPGRYSVRLDIRPEADADPDAVCCKIDVYVHPNIIFARTLRVRELRENDGKIKVDFTLKDSGRAEYRVFSTGTTGLRVAHDDRMARVNLENTSDLSFLSSGPKASEHAKLVFEENYPTISYLSQFGLTCEVGDRVIAAKDNVKMHVDAIEDLQVITEVFFMYAYKFILAKTSIVIDIGMNVGSASLFFATLPYVEKIYGFEPFKAPYLRAMDNFKLNPALSKKIQAHNFGLSNKFEELDVLAEELRTIGVSVRGAGSGRLERIQVRDISSELKELIMGSASRRIGIVVKVDCEGSEFPIFESLEREGLLKYIDALMIEWHKWWSKEKSQIDLIRPLSKAGFIVFDQTNPTNVHAGMLYAVRTA